MSKANTPVEIAELQHSHSIHFCAREGHRYLPVVVSSPEKNNTAKKAAKNDFLIFRKTKNLCSMRRNCHKFCIYIEPMCYIQADPGGSERGKRRSYFGPNK
jgi:hypothetical protein